MRFLGLSGATKLVSLGLIDDEKIMADFSLEDARSENLTTHLVTLGISPDDYDGVAVASGPGSYSGLRGSLAAAKTLAQVSGKPLVAVPTLEAIAYNLVEVEGTILVVLDARSNEYNVALFGAAEGRLKRLTEDLVLDLTKILNQLKKISGEIYLAGRLEEIAKEVKGSNYHFAGQWHSQPLGINVARLGRLKYQQGASADPLALKPDYSYQPNFREHGWENVI